MRSLTYFMRGRHLVGSMLVIALDAALCFMYFFKSMDVYLNGQRIPLTLHVEVVIGMLSAALCVGLQAPSIPATDALGSVRLRVFSTVCLTAHCVLLLAVPVAIYAIYSVMPVGKLPGNHHYLYVPQGARLEEVVLFEVTRGDMASRAVFLAIAIALTACFGRVIALAGVLATFAVVCLLGSLSNPPAWLPLMNDPLNLHPAYFAVSLCLMAAAGWVWWNTSAGAPWRPEILTGIAIH